MASYTKVTDFAAKDALASGNPSKIVKGTEIGAEFDAIQVADANNVKRDGTAAATSNLPMGNFKLTSLGTGSARSDSLNLGQAQDNAYTLIASISGVDTITGSLTPALTSYTAGQSFSFVTAGANTGAVTININGLGAKSITKFGTSALIAGDLPSGSLVQIVYDGTRFQLANLVSQTANTAVSATTATNLAGGALGSVPYQSASGTTAFLAAGTQGQAVVSGGAAAPVYGIPVLRGYIDGLIMSTAGSSATMTIAAGIASDSTNVFVMSLAASISKTTSSWAVGTGQGGLDTGAIANSTWYYFYLIRRPDTGVVDVVFSANSTTPTLPTNYTQYRYIGAGLTNGSAQWTSFIQTSNEFYWLSPPLDVNTTSSTSATLLTLSVPRKRVKAIFNVSLGGGQTQYFSDPSVTDLAPSSTATPLAQVGASSFNELYVWTNTSAQVRNRATSAGSNYYVATLGWIDPRATDA